MIWTRFSEDAPPFHSPIVVLRSVPLEDLPEVEAPPRVLRQTEFLPPPPSVQVPFVVTAPMTGALPELEVDLSQRPFEITEAWEEAAKPFPVPDPPVLVEHPPRPPEPEVRRRAPSLPRPSPVRRSAQVLRQVSPVYPATARRAGVEGQVLLAVAVQSNGRVGSVSLVSSSGNGLLDAAAMRAVRKWSFRPATIDGRAITGQVRVPVRFQLQ